MTCGQGLPAGLGRGSWPSLLTCRNWLLGVHRISDPTHIYWDTVRPVRQSTPNLGEPESP